MTIFWNFIAGLFFNWLSFRLSPGPPNAKRPDFTKNRIPKVIEGARIGKGYGTWIDAPFEAFSGDEDAVAIKKKHSKK